jgi:hypothetical protein
MVTGAAGSKTTAPPSTTGTAGSTTTTTGVAGSTGVGGMMASAAGMTGGAGMAGGAAGASVGAGGSAGMAGSTSGSAGAGTVDSGDCKPWPTANGQQSVSATIKVSGRMDGQLKRFVGSGALGSGSQDEGQDPLFELADGATLENVVIGAPAADGIHCKGTCTLHNVWWEDVGEDAATFEGSGDSQTMTVECAGAKKADDKVLQHNGPGTMIVKHFYDEDFGKLYRSCGNCKTQHERHVELSDIDARKGKAALAGINVNYNDTAKFMNITVHDTAMKLSICDKYKGNSSGDEPSKTGSGPDGKNCIYSDSDISWQP